MRRLALLAAVALASLLPTVSAASDNRLERIRASAALRVCVWPD